MNCPHCYFDNPADARFCQNCGRSLEQNCPACGTANALSANFCKQCGTRLAAAPPARREPAVSEPASERRIVTLLFCDVKGSTRLAEQLDPETWAEIMDGAFEYLVAAVIRYDGTVARLMGDAILAFFGAPVAHEDDPLRAIRAGLDMLSDLRPYQEKVRQQLLAAGVEAGPTDFEVRVGINTGLVVVGAIGSEQGREYTAMGDAANLAARMEQLARPGTVQIAQDTYKLVAPLIESKALGAVKVKGKRDPVLTYRVLALKARPGQLRGLAGMEAPLIGREREMAQLEWALADLNQGIGRIVTLVGEAGLGKSRLIAEIRKHDLAGASQWLEVASLSFEIDQPYGLMRRLIRRLLGVTEVETNRVMLEKLNRLMGDLDESQQEGIRQAARALFGITTGGEQPLLEGEALQEALATGMITLWREQAAHERLVLVFDDLHWADRASVELIGRLLPLVGEVPVLFLCVFRPDRDTAAWQLKGQAETDFPHRYTALLLQPLTDHQSTVLASSLLTVTDLPEALRDLILRKAEGIPFFVEEIVRELMESGAVVLSDDGSWRPVGEIGDIPVPESLESLLVSRMDRLEEPVRHTLQLAAVIGRNFYYRVLALVTGDDQGLDPRQLDGHLQTLQEAGLVREAARLPQREYMFRHVLTQEAAYNTILLKDRRRDHQRTGEVMAQAFAGELGEYAPLLAHHFAQAGDQAQALTYFTLAAENAARLYANAEALRHYDRALEAAAATGAGDEKITALLHGRGEIHERLGSFSGARADFEASLELARTAGDRQAEWQSLLDLGKLWASRDYDRTGTYFQQALEMARQIDDPASLAKSLNWVGNWYVNAAQPGQGIAYHQEALALFERLDDRPGRAGTHDLLGMANLIGGDIVASVSHYRQAIDLFRELQDYQGIVSSQSILIQGPGSYLNYTVAPTDNFEESDAAGREALQLARQIDWQAGQAFLLEVIGTQNAMRGQFDRALEPAQEALRLATGIGHHQWIVGAHVALGIVYQAALAFQMACDHLEQAQNLAREIRSQFWRHMTTGYLAQVYRELGQPARALDCLQEELAPHMPAQTIGQRLCWLARAEVALEQEEPALALEIVERLIAEAANMGSGVVISVLWLVRGDALHALGRVDEAETVLQEGKENARLRGERSLCWRFQASLARFYRDTARPERAGQEVEAGLALVENIAATIPEETLRDNFLSQAEKRLKSNP